MEVFGKTPRSGISLRDHTERVVESVKIMYGNASQASRLGLAWARFFRLSTYSTFFNALLASAVLHDWGKATDSFQNAIRHQGVQSLRHEDVSVLLLNMPQYASWLRNGFKADWDAVLAAVVSHHLRATQASFAKPMSDAGRIQVLIGESGYADFLNCVREVLQITDEPSLLPCHVWDFDDDHSDFSFGEHVNTTFDRLRRFDRLSRKDEALNRLVMAVRTALIAVDAIGSGITRSEERLDTWLQRAFGDEVYWTPQRVHDQIIERRVLALQRNKCWRDWSDFQKTCDSLPARSLLLAPCGAGKSLAAWRWIAAHCGAEVRRIIFLYPTRGTATEGFRDYVAWAPETEASLLHGTAEYDLLGMFENEDDRSTNSYNVQRKLYAVAAWHKSVFAATADQFLAFLQNQYASTCLLPLLADSVVVVDEVHSYDPSMFAALKDFLSSFDVPVLCMTATLPKSRQADLVSLGVHLYNEKPGDLAAIADAPRYRVRVAVMDDIDQVVACHLHQGSRVLWVVNTVSRAQTISQKWARYENDQLVTRGGAPMMCYHSRFRLEDRTQQHRNAVRSLQQAAPGPVLLVTTQVCEMGLDLDADTLVTEIAPVTSLIQRMGRCNRSRVPRDTSGNIFFYTPESVRPYDDDAMAGVADFLAHVSKKDRISQRDLEEALAAVPLRPPLPQTCSMLQCGPWADSRESSFREVYETCMTAVLDNDVQKYLELQAAGQSTAGLLVPVPRHVARADLRSLVPGGSRLPPHIVVAPASHYHPHFGFCSEPLS